MKSFHRWLILLLLIAAAIGCYAIGFVGGAGFFIIMGMIFELLFWVGLFKSDKNS